MAHGRTPEALESRWFFATAVGTKVAAIWWLAMLVRRETMNRFCICAVVAAVVVVGSGCGDTAGGGTTSIEGLVCGVDGKTYSVEEAANEEHEVSHRGRCDEPMLCESPNDCFVGDGCEPRVVNDLEIFPSGPQASWCVPGPTRCNCPGVFEPVCGGDGRNYINRCEAACAGVGARHDGFCEEPPGRGCVRAGCSGQLCVDEGVDIVSTCEWRPVYACYQEATCDRQPNGQCGFTPTHELIECLGQCLDDGDCPAGQYCQPTDAWPVGADASGPEPRPGVCMDLCALIDCAPGYVCELGQCVPEDCPVMTHVRTPDGRCEPKCYGPEQCGDEQYCNVTEVCLDDPACPACDVCVGWCEPSKRDCRPTGCNGEICADQDVASPCVALPEFACYRELGVCARQDWGGCDWTPTPELDMCLAEFDCRTQGCGEGDYCTFCWAGFACIPEGAIC